MKKGKFVISFVTFLFVAVGALLLRIGFDDQITARENERNARAEKYEPWVGDSIVLRTDTIEVVKYNKWRNEFLLADGESASPEMVSALKIR